VKRLMLAAVLVLCVSVPHLRAQNPDVRFELGLRLRAFETALAVHDDAAARKRAVPELKTATTEFLSPAGKTTEAARHLDRARFALLSDKEPPAELLWAASLSVRSAAKLLDVSAEKLPVTVRAFYAVPGGPPEKARVRVSLLAGGKVVGAAQTVELEKVPLEFDLPLKGHDEGDYRLRCEILQGDKVLAATEQGVSFARELDARVKKLQAAVEDFKGKPKTTDTATLARLADLLAALAAKKPQETSYPAARLFNEAEEVVQAAKAGKPFYGQKKPGQFWLTLPTEPAAPVRLLAPAAAKKGEPLPLVVAMHGVGGSDNIFFDGYGNGLAVRLCEERGWLLVGTRHALLDLAFDLEGAIDEVNKLYPVDRRRVFVLGHSLGAARVVGAASAKPKQVLAVAALAGGGTVKASDELKDVAFFVGVGKEELGFLLQGARKLNADLKDAGVKTVELKEYPDLEHLMIVQRALPDVFAFFDAAAKKRGAPSRPQPAPASLRACRRLAVSQEARLAAGPLTPLGEPPAIRRNTIPGARGVVIRRTCCDW
jgi:predicted esterase